MGYPDPRRPGPDRGSDTDFAPYGNPYVPGRVPSSARSWGIVAVLSAAVIGALALLSWTAPDHDGVDTFQTSSTDATPILPSRTD